MTAGGYLKRLTRLLTENLEQLDAETISQESQKTGAQRACDVSAGDEVTMCGELRSVQTRSKSMKTGIVAEFFDGTDVVTLKFIGRSRIPGIEPGRTLTVRGRIGEHDGHKVMFNPYYELLGES